MDRYFKKVNGRQVHCLPPYRPEHQIKLQKLLGGQFDDLADKVSIPLIQAIVEMRSVKSAEEVAEIEKAVDGSVDMHLAAIRMARPGVTELAIAAKVTELALAAGGFLSFPVISTAHGETLHNRPTNNVLQAGQLFLLDIGMETAENYAADLTSTCPVSPDFTPRQRDVYQVLLRTHLGAIDHLKPGVPYREVHLSACRTLAEGMKDLGLMRGNIADAVECGAHAMFLPHGLGHLMGLDAHDMESFGEVWIGYEGQPKSTQFGLKSLRLARPLKAGFVITCEPGIYFIPELIRRWKAENKFFDFINYDKLESYRDFGGIRFEENILITPAGHRVLGKKRPRTPEEIAAARA
jgi:Xaa-Pro aminopeptidase